MPTIYCMHCGAPLDGSAKFCTECGEPTVLGSSAAEVGVAGRLACPYCGALNDAGASRCSSCGSDLIDEPRRPRPTSAPSVAASGASRAGASRMVAMGIAAVLLVAAVFAGAGIISGLFSRLAGGSGGSEPAPAVVGDATSGETDEAGDPTAASANMGSAGVEVHDTLADYTWTELSVIAREMTRSDSREAALGIAREYGLVDADGNMAEGTKTLDVSGMGTLHVRIADIYHDNLADGEGRAGITFIATDLTLAHRMKEADDNIGGWEGAELRSWLNGNVRDALDEELRSQMVAVDKLTDNVGRTLDAASVTSTVDYLWIPSVVEVTGPISWIWDSDAGNSGAYNAVLNAEGFQYACFAGRVASSTEPNAGLVMSGEGGARSWWLRSCSASKDAHYRIVDAAGNPAQFASAPDELGVCLGFCL